MKTNAYNSAICTKKLIREKADMWYPQLSIN